MGFALPDLKVEDQLLALARHGDQAAIMEIYRLYFSPIYQFIRLRVEDSSVAEDLTSEVFVTLVDSLRGRNAPRQSLRGWLFKVARSQLQKHFGRLRSFPTTTLDEWIATAEDDLEITFMRSLSAERARQALRMLPPDQQEVLILRFGQGLDLQETAEIMGKQVGAIKSLQFRAVSTLRQILGSLKVGAYE